MIYSIDGALDDLGEKVNRTIERLTPIAHLFDSIAVRGLSGVLVGSPVSLALGKPLVIIRKPGEGSHSFREVENLQNVGKRYLFLDDFVSMGTTRADVDRALEGTASRAFSYLYQDDDLRME